VEVRRGRFPSAKAFAKYCFIPTVGAFSQRRDLAWLSDMSHSTRDPHSTLSLRSVAQGRLWCPW